MQEPSFQQRIQLDPIDRAKQPHSAHAAVSRIRNVLVQFQCRGTGDASFVLSVSSRRGNPSGGRGSRGRGGIKISKGWYPPAEGGSTGTRRRLKKVGPGSAGCQNCRLNMTRAPPSQTARLQLTPALRSAALPTGPPHRNPHTERQTRESRTRSIILDMASPRCSRARPLT